MYFLVPFSNDFTLRLKCNVKVKYKGKQIQVIGGEINLRAGNGINETVFKCKKDENGFCFSFEKSPVY